ncbi:YD repeat domain protein [Burkholderia pseudomallei MSHR4378]|nr:YD repeat domain protein [Burkholderia pseudomallei MSHR4378]
MPQGISDAGFMTRGIIDKAVVEETVVPPRMVDPPYAVVMPTVAVVERYPPGTRVANHPVPIGVGVTMRLAHRIDRGDQIDVSVVLVTDKRMRAAAGIDQGQRGEETYVVSRPAACARRARDHAAGRLLGLPLDQTRQAAVQSPLEHPRIAVEVGHPFDRKRQRGVFREPFQRVLPVCGQRKLIFEPGTRAQDQPVVLPI